MQLTEPSIALLAPRPAPPDQPAGPVLVHLVFAMDIAGSIDLPHARDLAQRAGLKAPSSPAAANAQGTPRTPESVRFAPEPLRLSVPCRKVEACADCCIGEVANITLYDFGAASVTFTIATSQSLRGLVTLADALYENLELQGQARDLITQLAARIKPALIAGDAQTPPTAARPSSIEDYVVYHFSSLPGGQSPDDALAAPDSRAALAALLAAELAPLGESEIEDRLAPRMSYSTSDLVIADWNAAILIGPAAADLLPILEYANVELLELRVLDDRLDRMLEAQYAEHTRGQPETVIARSVAAFRGLAPGAGSQRLRRLAGMQVDAALMFEGVNNAIKLISDAYFARVYRLAAESLHLSGWDASILRKLHTLDSIYQKRSDESATRRMEVLEWIIIILIALSTVLPFIVSSK